MRDTAPPGVQLHGASAALGTRHRKEEQIGPALASLGLLVRAEDIDTDALGTFDGRVVRTLTPLAAAEAKARGAASAALPGLRFAGRRPRAQRGRAAVRLVRRADPGDRSTGGPLPRLRTGVVPGRGRTGGSCGLPQVQPLAS